jgi:hypothetical protein
MLESSSAARQCSSTARRAAGTSRIPAPHPLLSASGAKGEALSARRPRTAIAVSGVLWRAARASISAQAAATWGAANEVPLT